MRNVRLEVTRKVILVGFGYGEPNVIGYAEHRSRSHDAVIRVYDEAGNVIETHEHKGELRNNDLPDHLCAVCAINEAGPRALAAARFHPLNKSVTVVKGVRVSRSSRTPPDFRVGLRPGITRIERPEKSQQLWRGLAA